jgi:hypothetical protein
VAIFVVQPDGKLVELGEEPYKAEDLLQQRLAEYPALLVSGDDESEGGKNYVLVRREAKLPTDRAGPDRWSVDHLFLDEEGIPTLVEVKRGTNTQIRREVVGQMFDYAANAVAYWPTERIRAEFEANCEQQGVDPDEALRPLLEESEDQEAYWQKVKVNLEAQRLRLVFVADEIPAELRRIVEYLNGQMKSTEVLAVEIKEFAGEGTKTLVSRVIGRTAAAQRAKTAGPQTEKQTLYSEFWASLISELRARNPGWAESRRSPPRHYLTIPSGRGGAWYSLVFTQDRRLRVELYIWMNDRDRAKARYASLEKQKDDIERAYRAPLTWEPLEGKSAKRIAIYSEIEGNVEDQDRWPQYRDWFVTTLVRFREALQPFVDDLPR